MELPFFVPPVVGAGAAAHADCAEGASVEEGACAGAGAGAGAGVGAGNGDGAAAFAGGKWLHFYLLLQSKSIWDSTSCHPAVSPQIT